MSRLLKSHSTTCASEKNRNLWQVILLAAASLSIPWTLACGASAQGSTSSTSNMEGLKISGTLPAATAQRSYAAVISVSGGQAPYEFSVNTGTLPGGVHLDPVTGALNGTPVSAGLYAFSVLVTDSTRRSSGVAPYHLAVTPFQGGGDVSVLLSPETATVSSSAKQQFLATVSGTSNTAVTWSASGGTMAPAGWFVAPSVVQPTQVTVTATSVADTSKSASAAVTVTPQAGSQKLVIQTTSISSAESGQPYQATLAASGGQTPYKWSSSGSLPAGVTLSTAGVVSGTATSTGSFTFTAAVKDAASHSAQQALTLTVSNTSGNFDGPAELPRTQMKWSLADTPAPGKTIPVNAGGNLNSALASASCGDTIALQAGATFQGFVTLPAKPCDDQHWIVIRTSAPDTALPPEGQRLTPCFAGVASLPNRPPYGCTSPKNVMARLLFSQTSQSGPVVFENGANHYRFIGLEITRTPGNGPVIALVSSVPEAVVDHIVVDRSWIHGTAHDDTRRGLNLNGVTYAAVVDSYFNDFHCTALSGSCTDSQAVSAGGGDLATGTWQIEDNFLEAAAESILLGGDSSTIIPQDITIRRNHFYKPPQWRQGAPGFVGGPTGDPFVVKNHFEIKNATRVLLENNILENSWGGFTQAGYSLMITPRNTFDKLHNRANQCPVCSATDITFRFNRISHVGGGIEIANALSNNEMAAAGGRDSIHDVTIDDVNGAMYKGPGSLILLFNGWSKNSLNSVSIRHVTGMPDQTGTILSVTNSLDYAPMWGLTFQDNLIVSSRFPIWSAGAFGERNCAGSDVPITVLSNCFHPYTFDHNVIANVTSAFPPSKWPSGNVFPATVADVDFTNFNNGNGGNYQLLSGSPYKNTASDGTDPGADIVALDAAIQGVN